MVSPLISTAELAAAMDAATPPTVLDVRWALGGPPGIDEYLAAHVPGARFVDLERELAGPPGPGRHPLPDAAAFQAAMRAHGVQNQRPVVVYDAATSMAAARAWWTLRYFGHGDVRVLDGGFSAWQRSGLPVETGGPHAATPGDFTAVAGHMPLLDAAGAARVASSGVLIDARAGERFRGEVEPVDPVAGHIPGAVNLPTSANVDEAGRFLAVPLLDTRLRGVQLDAEAPIGVYCGSGVTAAHEVLALALTGRDAALYVGSWSDWITDASRPVARGS
jgi:thiosulfate/3-mercaptopyruvate sulfurtransferase